MTRGIYVQCRSVYSIVKHFPIDMLERFFAGVLSQLQAEVDLINALVPHNATKGTLNEESLRRILTAFLPTRYAVGTGFVIDSFGKRSRQVDLVKEEDEPLSRLLGAHHKVAAAAAN